MRKKQEAEKVEQLIAAQEITETHWVVKGFESDP